MDNKTKVRESTAAKIDRSPKVTVRTVWGELIFCPEFLPKSDPIFTVMAKVYCLTHNFDTATPIKRD